jgi:uncharacterized protein
MMWSLFIAAMGLLFVFEGILPFLSPVFWRQMMHSLIMQSDRFLRIMGLSSMLIGLALVLFAHNFN